MKEFDIPGEDIDVVHWNAGLWDCLRLFGEEPHTPIEVYSYYIDRLCVRIKKICPNAKVIFATSTSVRTRVSSNATPLSVSVNKLRMLSGKSLNDFTALNSIIKKTP
jgi:hypothetical protein